MAKVFVGMSGGVDSSVSAALLKRAGHTVTGVFIKVWQPDWIECNWKEERIEAMRAAAHLDIPFITLDLEKEYKEGVIDYMIHEYQAGRTPNPDVMCNREVKFGAFWQWAKKNGADFIATGHYAQNTSNELHVSTDTEKDQTYFLWTLTKNDLEHVMFPVGHMKKDDVRKLARELELPNADKKDSQGLCFIGKVDVKEFLSRYIKSSPGNVVDSNDKVIGTHTGSVFLTIGERHGFTISAKTPNDRPYFVISKDIKGNTVTVSDDPRGIETSAGRRVRLENVSWVNEAPVVGDKVKCRSRYREALHSCILIQLNGSNVTIEFDESPTAITSGQSLVIYSGDKCLGGGIIV